MKQILFAGLDVSTQSSKLVVIDYAAGAVIYTDSVNFDTDLPQYNTRNGVIQGLGDGVSEADPNMWLDALKMLFQRLKTSSINLKAIASISVSGQQHGLVALDEAGDLTRPHSKLWNDFSTTEECELLTEAAGGLDAMIDQVGNSQRTGYTACKILNMKRQEPEAFDKTSTFFLVHNYINWYLTGGKNGGRRVMEPGDVSGMALWHPIKGDWSDCLVNFISPDLADKFPTISPSQRSLGKVSAELVQTYGFSPNCTIDAGSGDNMYSAVGTGNISTGIVTISLGTSGTIYTFMDTAWIDHAGEIAAFRDSTGYYLPLLCVSNMANGYNEILAQYGISHDEFNEIIEQTPAGNNGRILIPWYMGERTPNVPQAAPLYFGFGLNDFNRECLCRAVLEGHVLNLFEGFKKMPVQAKEIRLTGGLSQSKAWRQTIADIFDTETVPVEGEGAALGAALHAAWVWQRENGKMKPIKEIVRPFIQLREADRCRPIPENVAVYQKMKPAYFALSARMRGVKDAADPFALRAEMLDKK
ncbi:hypothetical protein KAH55_08300 [bacterium]|nr:hypothetical protein [bacterium]